MENRLRNGAAFQSASFAAAEVKIELLIGTFQMQLNVTATCWDINSEGKE